MPFKQQHILLLSSYLNVPGGYEKMVVSVANLFHQHGHRVSILVADYTGERFYPIHSDVQVFHQNLHFGISQKGNFFTRKWQLVRHVIQLRTLINRLQPSVVIASEYQLAIAAVLAGATKKAITVSWEHHHFGVQQRNRFWSLLFTSTYPKLHAVVALNKDEQRCYLPFNKRATVIPNFINGSTVPAIKTTESVTILTVTRFNHIKGIDLLLRAVKAVLDTHVSVKWRLIGYGQQEDLVKTFIREEGLEGRLIYIPATDYNIEAEYLTADLFVLSSRNECFPLTLLEALRAGLPCVAFDCPTGPRHIIQNDETGFLVPPEDVDALVEKIGRLCMDADLRGRMSRAAFASAAQFYPDVIYPQWARLWGVPDER